MKISMHITEDAMQFNLMAESEHEKQMVKILSTYTGPVSISQGVSVALTQGNYLREFGRSEYATTITIAKEGK